MKHILITAGLKKATVKDVPAGTPLTRAGEYSDKWLKPDGFNYALLKESPTHSPPEGQVVLSANSSIISDSNDSGYSITHGVPVYGETPAIVYTDAIPYKLALAAEAAGHDIDDAISKITDPAMRRAAEVAWAKTPATIRKDHPLIPILQSILTLDDDQIDALFIAANQLFPES